MTDHTNAFFAKYISFTRALANTRIGPKAKGVFFPVAHELRERIYLNGGCVHFLYLSAVRVNGAPLLDGQPALLGSTRDVVREYKEHKGDLRYPGMEDKIVFLFRETAADGDVKWTVKKYKDGRSYTPESMFVYLLDDSLLDGSCYQELNSGDTQTLSQPECFTSSPEGHESKKRRVELLAGADFSALSTEEKMDYLQPLRESCREKMRNYVPIRVNTYIYQHVDPFPPTATQTLVTIAFLDTAEFTHCKTKAKELIDRHPWNAWLMGSLGAGIPLDSWRSQSYRKKFNAILDLVKDINPDQFLDLEYAALRQLWDKLKAAPDVSLENDSSCDEDCL